MKRDTRSFYTQAVQTAIEHVARHLDDAIDLDTLARLASLSPFHFHRVFRGMVGETPMELVRRLRLERAAWMLVRSDQPVTMIAFAAGYESHEAFTRVFRATFGVPPSGFRERGLMRIELAAPCGVHFEPSGAIGTFIPRDSGGSSMDVRIQRYPRMRVACVRHVGPYNQIASAFATLGSIAGPAGLFADPGAAMVALYHDIPETTPPEQLRSDAAIVIAADARVPAGLSEQVIPAGTFASTVHTGPYEQLGDAWARLLGEWLPASGHRMADGVSYEAYLNDPSRTTREALMTELRIPLIDA